METPQAELKQCVNCGQEVPAQNYTMHEIYCARHNTRCKKCGVVVKKSDLVAHEETAHKLATCECGQEMEESKIDQHRATECILRPMSCPVCSLDVEAHEFDNHVEYCGNRTEECPSCHRFVKLLEFQAHTDSNCTYPEPPKAAPPPSIEDDVDQIRARILGDFFPSRFDAPSERRTYRDAPVPPTNFMDSLMMCPVCSAPFQDFVELQQHFSGVHRVQEPGIHDPVSFSRIEPVRIKDEVVASCPFCEKTFTDEETCLSHISMAHDHDIGESQPSPQPSRQRDFVMEDESMQDLIPCDICQKSIPLQTYGEHHAQCTIDRLESGNRVLPIRGSGTRQFEHMPMFPPTRSSLHSTRRAESTASATETSRPALQPTRQVQQHPVIRNTTSRTKEPTSAQILPSHTAQQRPKPGASHQKSPISIPIQDASVKPTHHQYPTRSSAHAIQLDDDDDVIVPKQTGRSTSSSSSTAQRAGPVHPQSSISSRESRARTPTHDTASRSRPSSTSQTHRGSSQSPATAKPRNPASSSYHLSQVYRLIIDLSIICTFLTLNLRRVSFHNHLMGGGFPPSSMICFPSFKLFICIR
eukprot:TRINITY_DN4060_c0_g1_i2.p1 TRINITY_DN4060_c0_g1~~TRINITY_DN4060_c0_g1_i2.p1  ORF type:complete len:584 (-),score=55.68 TRINITY_DN4060_c0_g1_i2:309-2060(-)